MNEELADNAFLRARHSAAETPRAEVEALIVRATGSAPATLARIVRGYDNEVYEARTSTGAEVVVRIGRFGTERPGFATETWAMDLARSAGVPVPPVLLLDSVDSTDDGELPAMVLERVPGRPAAELSPDDPRREHALAEAGALLARLHTVTVGGYWRPDDDGNWPTADWATLMTGFSADRPAERQQLRQAGFADSVVNEMLGYLDEFARTDPGQPPVLCHGDFIPEHIFVDEHGRVTGVIDFGELHGGAPTGDLAHLRYCRSPADFNAVCAGYEPAKRIQRWSWRTLDLHVLALAMGHLAHEIAINDRCAAIESASAIRSVLDRLRLG